MISLSMVFALFINVMILVNLFICNKVVNWILDLISNTLKR